MTAIVYYGWALACTAAFEKLKFHSLDGSTPCAAMRGVLLTLSIAKSETEYI